MFFAYLVRCADGTLYGGYTTDLQKRLAAHNSGKGAKYTRSRLPVELVYWEECPTKEAAMSREWQLKHLTREKKLELIHFQKEQGIKLPGQVVRVTSRRRMPEPTLSGDIKG